MHRRANAFMDFVRCFVRNALHVREVLLGLLALLLVGGVAISYVEQLDLAEAIYFSFITGLTIGYGDIAPATNWGRVLCVLIGLIGMTFTGITVAVATHSLADSLRHNRHETT